MLIKTIAISSKMTVMNKKRIKLKPHLISHNGKDETKNESLKTLQSWRTNSIKCSTKRLVSVRQIRKRHIPTESNKNRCWRRYMVSLRTQLKTLWISKKFMISLKIANCFTQFMVSIQDNCKTLWVVQRINTPTNLQERSFWNFSWLIHNPETLMSWRTKSKRPVVLKNKIGQNSSNCSASWILSEMEQ